METNHIDPITGDNPLDAGKRNYESPSFLLLDVSDGSQSKFSSAVEAGTIAGPSS